MVSDMKKRVAIIGAGPSGLPAIRHAVAYGVIPVCFESSDKIGGVWNYTDQESPDTSVMHTTVMNSSKEMSAYSDFPPEADKPNFMHHTQLLQYFCDYASHFDLEKYVRLNHTVQNIYRSESFKNDGKWVVEFKDDKGVPAREVFDGVLVAIGHHQFPNQSARWSGQDQFKGKIIHAKSYKHCGGYDNKRVVVVGVGNSGIDIAVELSRISQNIVLSSRRGCWIAGRTSDYGVPLDVATNSRFFNHALLPYVPSFLKNYLFERKLNMKFDHEAYGLRPAHSVFGAHLTTNDDIGARLFCGSITIKPNIQSFTANDVVFEDGSRISNVDEVILATGYNIKFPIIENGKLIKTDHNQLDLYKFMYPVGLEKNTLAVLGCIQPSGCVWPIAEMQSRVFLAHLTGEAELPTVLGMETDVHLKRIDMMNTFYGSDRHTIQVSYVPYMDELAALLGCRPHFADFLLSDPCLAYETTFGPCSPYVYRLKGPHVWTGARDAILKLKKRVRQGYNPGKNSYRKKDVVSIDVYMLLIVLTIAILCYFLF
ncbi:unnamed protein product [Auanema sp. JU1783]|nr:unnamed protein product [Auanema sp. JU1783]